MFNNATLCFALGLLLFGEGACFADDAVPPAATEGNGIKLTRVELFPAGQGVFEYESTEAGDVELMLPLTRHELDDLLKSLVLKGFDSAKVDYEPNADRNNIVSQVLSSEHSMTRAELLQGLKGHAIQLTDKSSSMSGVIMAVELQSHQKIAGQEIEVITLRTAEGIEQHVLTAATRITFADKSIQSQLDQALGNLARPIVTRTPATLKLKKKVRGPAGIAFQTETAAWKCSYRIAKIDGEYQLVVAAVIDNTSGMDWIDVELVLIVDQPLGFHAPISTVHRAQRTNMLIPSPFSAAPPALAAGSKRNLGELLADGPMENSRDGSTSGMGGAGMGGMGGAGMGGMGGSTGTMGGNFGGYTSPQKDGSAIAYGGDSQDIASQLGMSFPVGDLSRGIAGQRVRIQLPKVTIRAGASESVFLPSIPRIIDDVRVYVASVSKKYPLSAFLITLQDGYQLPGGPGTVWSDSGYAGDIMFPRLVAQVPQLVTYALDTSVEITSEILPEHASKTTYRFDGEDTLIGVKISQRLVRYSLSNESKSAQTVWIEHQPAERNWSPEPVGDQVGKSDLTSFRYKVDVPSKSTAKQDILETETTITKWPKGTNWIQLKYLTEAAGMTPEIRDRLETRIRKLAEYDVLKATETKLIGSKENAVIEQRRIKELMIVLNREDDLHNRYLKKLATLESEIESSAERIITVRKELEDSKTRLGQER